MFLISPARPLAPTFSMLQRFISVLYYLSACGLAGFIVVNAGTATEAYGVLYEHFSPSNKADTEIKTLLESLSFGLYQGGSRKTDEIEGIIDSAEYHERRAYLASWALLGVSVTFVLIKMVPWFRPGTQLLTRKLIAHLLAIALVFLGVGLLAPILSLVAYTEVTLLGKVVFKYESKGVITTVLELMRSGNLFIAGVLFLFSVVTPVIKHIFAFIAILATRAALRRKYVHFLAVIGKWSMADVMVVAVIALVFLSPAKRSSPTRGWGRGCTSSRGTVCCHWSRSSSSPISKTRRSHERGAPRVRQGLHREQLLANAGGLRDERGSRGGRDCSQAFFTRCNPPRHRCGPRR